MKPQALTDLVAALDGHRTETALATECCGSALKKLTAVTLHWIGQNASTVYEVRVNRECVKLTSSLDAAIRYYVEVA